jgi:iron complex outermembrane receptor protein
MKKIFMILGLACSAALAYGQTGTITGKIINASGEPAANVLLSLEGTNIETATDENGNFTLQGTEGSYKLIIHSAYAKKKEIEVKISDEETLALPDIKLGKNVRELDEVVIGGQRQGYNADKVSSTLRLETPLLETPQNIQIITAKALADQQVVSMSDGAIRNVSGATKIEHWDQFARINMRGSRASAFRNGVNVVSSWGPLAEDMSTVDHIEFVKGPAGFMMSNGEPSGIYNIVTKKPTGVTRGEASFMMGSYDLYRAALDLDGHLDKNSKLLYRLNVMGQTQNSFRDYQFNNKYGISPVLTYRIDDNTSVTAEYSFQYVRMSDVGSSYVFSPKGYADLPRNFTTAEPGIDPTVIKDHSLFLYLHHKFNEDWKVTAQVAYLNFKQDGSSLWPNALAANGDMIRSIGNFDAANQSRFGQVFVNGNVETGPVHHRILAGLDLGVRENTYDWSQGGPLDDSTKPFNIYHPVYGSPKNGIPVFDRTKSLTHRAGTTAVNQSYSGIYLQDEIGFWENRIRLTLAGRYTYVRESSYGTIVENKRFTPRIGLSVSVNKSTSLYALYDQSFMPQSGLLRGGKLPEPVTGNNMEVGIKKDWLNGRWSSTLSVYRILKNGQLVTDPDTSGGNQNLRYSLQLGQTRTEGVELDIRGEIVNGLNLIVNYAYTNSEISKDIDESNVGSLVPGFAKHVANGWLTYRIQEGVLRGVGFSGGFTYQKDRSTWSWGADNQMALPDYFRLDGGLSWQNNKMTVVLNVNNVLDKYLYSGAPYGSFYYWQTEAPRNFRLSVGYRF